MLTIKFRHFLCLSLIVLTACANNEITYSSAAVSPQVNRLIPSKINKKEVIVGAKLIAVGDIMMHKPQITAGYNAQKKTYNFDQFFTEVKPILSQGDWVMGNLETTLAGSQAKYTGYPLFNAPAELVDSLKKAGFNILTTANNHSLDRGEKGVLKTIQNIRDRNLLSTGTFSSPQAAKEILMVTKNQIKMAILAYTYGTNGIPIPKGKNYLVNLIDQEKMIKDIAKARALGADIVTICVHFGIEYQRWPNASQKKLVNQLVNAGADLILGSHPHVLQPYQIFQLGEKNGKKRKAVAIYSMGNFISNQVGNYRDFGVIFQVKISKNLATGVTEISQVETLPTWVHRYRQRKKLQYRVLGIEKTIAQKNDRLLPKSKYVILKRKLKEIDRHLRSKQSN